MSWEYKSDALSDKPEFSVPSVLPRITMHHCFFCQIELIQTICQKNAELG